MTRTLSFNWLGAVAAGLDWHPLQAGVDILPEDLRIVKMCHVATREEGGTTYYLAVQDGWYHVVRYATGDEFDGTHFCLAARLDLRYRGDDDEIVNDL